MKPIHDYAVIGDCRAAALVSRDGSIDWLSWPRFDSPSIFAAILDDRAGRWSLTPAAPFRTERRYVDETNVLQTMFHTDTGSLLLTDLMPVVSEDDKRKVLWPSHEILRVLVCERGEIDVEMVFEPRPHYGANLPKIRDAGKLGWRVEMGAELLTLRTDMPGGLPANGRVWAKARLRAGEQFQFSLTYADESQAILPPLGQRSRDAVASSIAWWRGWTSKLKYDGPAREAVVRSALALKLLVHAPSGAIVAAPTTSLPERIGGDLNWDYRFCWLRDASMTVRALLGLGFFEEAEAFVGWLLHATRLTQPRLRVLYDVYGREPEGEHELAHLGGHQGSRPVRVGNAAKNQVQLDLYGEVIDAAAHLFRHEGTFDRDTQRMLSALGEYVCRNWSNPDEGIWEPRWGKAHNTHSRVLCWTALERLVELHQQGCLRGAPVDKFIHHRELIRRDVEQHGYSSELGSYVARLGGNELDASLLLIAWYGFDTPSSERMRTTYARIREHLGAGGGLLYRYRTESPRSEGAFGICGFWGAEYLARGGGSLDEAQAVFEQLCGYANDVGLFAEEIDPVTGAALGNFPQAFTHVGLINAALTLGERRHRARQERA